ncbi:MAG: SDR family NAD(P)-dependent oxidoreductase, partial [Loktanella sp.]|nr:SDR family NAD(P)-dependent oxidoreductase [Loktanella sp.]
MNFDSCFIVFKALEDQLIAGQGAVVNIVSVNGMGVFGHPGYSAAKAGMIHLTRPRSHGSPVLT